MLIGVDEAGRGPVVGSMFVAAVGIHTEEELPSGVRDSKQLAAETREQLAEQIYEVASVATVEVTADTIDDEDQDLNTLTLKASADAVSELIDRGSESVRVVADACDVSEARYRNRLMADLPDEVTVEAHHGADDAVPVVSAASIVAKSAREAHVATLATAHGEIGSGYPSDPTTQAFLRETLAQDDPLPACVRGSWGTVHRLRAEQSQGSLTDY